MNKGSEPNLLRMAEVALTNLGQASELWEIYEHVQALGYQPGNHLVGMTELGTTLYKNQDHFTPNDDDTWTLAAWQQPTPTTPVLPATPATPQVTLAEAVETILREENGALSIRAIRNRIETTFNLLAPTTELLETLRSVPGVELVGPGRYALRGAAPTDPLLDLWLTPSDTKVTPAPTRTVTSEEVTTVQDILNYFDRLMSVEEITEQAAYRHKWDPQDEGRVRAILEQSPDNFLKIKKRYYGLSQWEGSAKALLFGSGAQRVIASLVHEYLQRNRRGADLKQILMTLGNDPRWPHGAPKTINSVTTLLTKYDHVFMRIRRRRAGANASDRQVWTLQPYAREATPIAPKLLSAAPAHPLGDEVPPEMPRPNPLIRSEIARLAHVAIRGIGRSATVDEISDLMLTKLNWKPSGSPKAVLINTLSRRKDLFRKVRAGRYAVRKEPN